MKSQQWALVAAVTLVFSVVLFGAIHRMKPPPASVAESFTEKPHSLEPLYPAPSFAYTDQHGATVTPLALKGTPYIANFIFTTCRTICPLLTTKMVQLQRQLPGAPLRFVSFSVDPTHDTPKALAAYARYWNSDETRWALLATDDRTLPLTAAGFHITAMNTGTPTDLDPIIHSAVFLLVDGEGMVRGVYDSEDREDFKALLRDARTLSHAAPPTPVATRDGVTLYHDLSCANCHDRPTLAPPLGGILDNRRALEASNLITVDRPYIKESIVLPDAKRVAGFPLKMPTYEGLLSDQELETLIDFVIALPKVDGAPNTVSLAEDPVCHMRVRLTDDVLHAEFDGGTYYFCSDYCRDRFIDRPGAFLKD